MEPSTGNSSPKTCGAERGRSSKTIAGIVVIAILVGAVALFATPGQKVAPTTGDSMEKKVATGSVEKNVAGDSMEKEMDQKVADSVEQKVEPAPAGIYAEYDAAKLSMAASGDVVIFFHASWCPACRSADAALSGSPVPSGLTVLKADYDASADLKQKYGVTSQHTFVQVDAAGNLVQKWMGSRNAADIAANVK